MKKRMLSLPLSAWFLLALCVPAVAAVLRPLTCTRRRPTPTLTACTWTPITRIRRAKTGTCSTSSTPFIRRTSPFLCAAMPPN